MTAPTPAAPSGLNVLGPLGLFEGHSDVGPVDPPGSASYDPAAQLYRIAGPEPAGSPVTARFRCLWKRMRGDFILQARVAGESAAQSTASGGTLGWAVRSSLEEGSPQVSLLLREDGQVALQLRRVAGGHTEDVHSTAFGAVMGADVLQLERRGNRYRASAARFGDPFVSAEVADVDLGDEVYAALVVSSHEVVFDNVRIVTPAPAGYVPTPTSRDLPGGHLETLDIESGRRLIIFSSAVPFEAPNWTPDGKVLIFNSFGRLYRLKLEGATPEVIDTGFAVRNNNDHVLSFDGNMLGISHHSEEDGGKAIVYVLPSGGGVPRRVTANGPSYLHGWSPDGKYLVYCGMRGGAADIYRISVHGGEETRLTSAPGLNDGPEYSPDGRYIYFNSVRSGTMQIWRMRPDGSEQEQVTDDEYNNWFAHVSPDGQRIVFLSYGQDVAPGDHPPDKQVCLRTMPPGGGAPRVVAYVYGGQGTINVPSWSPDSTRVAFVSYTVMR